MKGACFHRRCHRIRCIFRIDNHSRDGHKHALYPRKIKRLFRQYEDLADTWVVHAAKHNTQAIGIELEERYCEIAAKRIGQTRVLYTISGGVLVYDHERDGR